MRRFFLLLLLTSCAGSDTGTTKAGSPESDPSAPGMIPSLCESLLQKAQEWGYVPGQKWKPASLEQAEEMRVFFSGFHLVPEASAQFFQQGLEKDPSSEAEAKTQLEKFAKAQVCDPSLSLLFLDALIDYRWPQENRVALSRSLHRFLLNQQSRVAPLLVRAVSVSVFAHSLRKGLLKGAAGKVQGVRQWMEKERQEILSAAPEEPSALENWKILKKEFALSEEARTRLSRFLPLP